MKIEPTNIVFTVRHCATAPQETNELQSQKTGLTFL